MIKVETKMGETNVTLNGCLTMLSADTCAIVRSILHAIEEEDKIAGRKYRDFVRELLATLVLDDVPEPENAKHEQGGDEFVNAIVDALIAAIMRSKS